MILAILALIFAVLLGYSLAYIPLPSIEIGPAVWIAVSAISAIGLFTCLYLSRSKKKKGSFMATDEWSKFQKEFKLALRGHLKVSILFWSYYYKKEKVKTLEEAKREVFQSLKKEFTQIHWMESVLEDIRQELAKYK